MISYNPGDLLLNKYRIEKLIGRGAFAEVYLARHAELNAPRALKVLRKDARGLGSSDFQDYEDRFVLEAQLGARFDHPNLVRVHDFEHEDDTLILVMEYCPGGNLSDLLHQSYPQGQNLSVERVIQIGSDIARGLAQLHQQAIVHRDLKPNNILFDAQGRAKVADLGLAQTPGGLSQRSILGSLAPIHPGTPGYMSPEQESQTAYLRAPSDVYALGLILFESLSGRNYSDLKPGTKLLSLRPDSPTWLDELLGRMLAKDPEQRPWESAEVLGLLEQGRQEEQQRKEEQEKTRQEALQRQHREEEERQRQEAQEKTRQEALQRQHREEEECQRQEAQEKTRQEEEFRRRQAERQQRELEEKQRLAASQKAQQTASLKKWLWPALILLSLMIGYWALSEFPDPKPTPTLNIPATADIPASPAEALPASASQGDPWISPVDGMVLAYIPAGDFEMGSENGDSDEVPVHTVYLDAFWMDTTEVTNGQYAKCVEDGDCRAPLGGSNTRNPYFTDLQYKNFPVTWVSWDDANDYCTWAGRRLPTEAEWEKAARGGLEGKDYPWGDEAPVCSLGAENGANFGDCSFNDTIEVGSFGANGYGLYDMAGNVWEWVFDWYSNNFYASSPAQNPTGPGDTGIRVMRGGSWNGGSGYLRVANRGWNDPVIRVSNVGFRCAR